MIAFKWTVVILWLLSAGSALYDIGKHGQPRTPYDARASAIGVVVGVLLAFWAMRVLP